MLTFQSRVRYSETGADLKLTTESAINYLQDTSMFHLESKNLGAPYLKSLDLGLFVISWQIEFLRYPSFMEDISVKTWIYKIDKALGYRNFLMEDNASNALIKANCLGAFVDLETGRAVIPPACVAGKITLFEKADMVYRPRKIKVPLDMTKKASIKIEAHHLDSNGHVNNNKYISLCEQYLPKDFGEIRCVRVEYKRPAMLFDVLIPSIFEENGRLLVCLNFENGDLCCVTEFSNENTQNSVFKGQI